MTKKSFKDVYVGATEVAKLMGIHPETLRKRAKSGKVPGIRGANGVWTFVTSELAKAGIEPFASALAAAKPAVKNFTDVVFVLDRSGSMSGLLGQAKKNLDEQVSLLKAAVDSNNEYTVSVINFNDHITRSLVGLNLGAMNLNQQAVSSYYEYASGGTSLNDAISDAIRLCQDRDDGKRAFLISVLTDGDENSSNTREYSLLASIRALNSTDRFTFTLAGPRGAGMYAGKVGILPGNVTTWEQTREGLETLQSMSRTSFSNYTRSRSLGETKSASFYASPVTKDAAKFAGQLDNKLDDVSDRVKVERVTVSDPIVIRKFCERKFGSFPKGDIYYQLTESEKVQDYKKLIVQDTTTGNFFTGSKAKTLLGVPNFTGTVKIKPGELGEFKIFVQSTSVNRKLTPGTAVVYLP